MLRVLRCVLRFRLCFCLAVVMCHVRAVRFVHALCSDVVVIVPALWFCVLFLLLFALFVGCCLFFVCVFMLPFAVLGIRLLEITCLFLF